MHFPAINLNLNLYKNPSDGILLLLLLFAYMQIIVEIILLVPFPLLPQVAPQFSSYITVLLSG